MLFAVALVTAGPAAASPHAVDAPETGSSRLELPELPRGFDTHDAGWLKLAYPASLSHWVAPLVEEANAFRTTVRASLGKNVLERVSVRLAEDPGQMALLAPVDAPYPKYAVGVAYSRANLILLTQEPVHPNGDHKLREVLRHELAHVALHAAVRGRHVPLWFNEGLAIHLAQENSFARIRTLWTAAVSSNLIPLRELDARFPKDIVGVPLAYAQSADVVRYLLRQQDDERFRLLIQRVGRGQAFDRALYDSYGMDLYNLERNWLVDVDSRYSVWPVLFSGTLIWGGASLLIFVAWRRKRRHHRVTMQRWAREEALEDARLLLLREHHSTDAEPKAAPPREGVDRAIVARSSLVPKVQHEGDWHTLH